RYPRLECHRHGRSSRAARVQKSFLLLRSPPTNVERMMRPRLTLGALASITLLVCRALVAQAPTRDTAAAVQRSTLIGTITDSAGVGIEGVEIGLVTDPTIHTVTGDSGLFRLLNLPPGEVSFTVRRLGYQSASFTANLKPGKTSRMHLSLDRMAQQL